MSIRNLITSRKLSLLVCVLVTNLAAGRVIYVDTDAPGANNGSRWVDAYIHLQDALAAVRSGDEIRVAQGIYRPDRGVGMARGDREATFQLISGVTVQGGYAGFGKPDPDVRDTEAFETILSGDLNGDDIVNVDPQCLLAESRRIENSYHVVTARNVDETAVLDSFTIRGGNANNQSSLMDSGGGMLCIRSNPRVKNCSFSSNRAEWGGGIYNYDNSRPRIESCAFSGNSARVGGGVYNRNSYPTTINCVFSGNWARLLGGGVYHVGDRNTGDSTPVMLNCTFSQNQSSKGGGVYGKGALMFTNCIFWGNTDDVGNDESSQIQGIVPVLGHCCIQGWTGSLGGGGNHGANPLFVDPDGPDNIVGTEDDSLRLLAGSPCIDSGDNLAIPPGVAEDINGNPRLADDPLVLDTGRGRAPIVDIGAYEGANQGFILSTNLLEIPEGGTADLTVALAAEPLETIEVIVAIESGVPHITVESSQTLVFDSSNYRHPQTIKLAAAQDTNYLHESAVISISAMGLPVLHVLVREVDNVIHEVLHVDKRAHGTQDGTSWKDAFDDLQGALKIAAATPTVKEVRVARGVYTPTGPHGDREATFQLINGIAILGGYAGLGEPDSDARNVAVNKTVLSGDLQGNDILVDDPSDWRSQPTRAENSYHVVTGSNTSPMAVLDGFTVTGGTATAKTYPHTVGGGILNKWGDPTIVNCTFAGNIAAEVGGGMYNEYSSPTITSCEFRENAANMGGGIWGGTNLRLANCAFSRNIAFCGGAIYVEFGGHNVINCRFSGNSAYIEGGGMYSSGRRSRLLNCVFTGNSAMRGGGICIAEGDPVLVNCTLVGNSARNGSALACVGSSEDISQPQDPKLVKLSNSILWNDGDQIYDDDDFAVCSITYSDVKGGWPGEGNIDVDPDFVDVDGPDDLIGTQDDNPRLRAGSPCIDAGHNEADTNINAPGDQSIIGVDADLNVRRFDSPTKIDAGRGKSPIVDMGAYESDSLPIPSILYVDDDAKGAKTGTAWEDAFTDLQLALETASVTCRLVTEIWVADGTYVPIHRDASIVNLRTATFRLMNGLGIYGGFMGVETSLAQRDWVHHTTTLSGDFNGDDGPSFENSSENSLRVVTASHTNSTAILDGFVITAGNNRIETIDVIGSGNGAGLHIVSGSPVISNCFIAGNAADLGGGVYCGQSSPKFSGCVISKNLATNCGGGLYCNSSTLELCESRFDDNRSADLGGGLYVVSGSPWIRRCTFVRNSAASGGAVYCERSSATFTTCMFADNTAVQHGGGIYCYLSTPTLDACTVRDNMLDGVWIENTTIQIMGSNNIAANAWMIRGTILEGDGALQIQSDVSLDFDDSRVRCNVIGPGALLVSLGSELIIESKAEIDLGHETDSNGRIMCDGLLRVKDNATISNAQVNVTRANFEDNAIIANCVIRAEAGVPYGQFYIEDNVHIWLDRIEADGDRYLDLDPSEFDCNNIHIDAIDVKITEGAGGIYGGLFEARGRELENLPCDPDGFFCQVDTVPDFDPSTWTLDQLELAPGAKVNLTNRFDFQAPYDSGGDEEVLYVKQIVLGPGSVLNTAFNRLYYETLIMDPTARIMNIPLLGFSLNNIGFNNEDEFLTRVKHNNFEHSEEPAYDRLHIERVEGLGPDPNGMMQMCNLLDLDPESSSYQQVISARAKGLFAKASEGKILIKFEYLFSTSEPGLELVVYLTDVPELLEHHDPDRQDHYVKVAHLRVPPMGRPGSPGSGRFGVFHKYVKRGKLDFIRGTRIEFELVGPADACVLINNWDPQVHCNELYCGDITGDHGATVLDYLTVIANVGSPAGLLPDGTSTACLEFGFGVDGRIDTLDVSAWAWMLSREELPNLCDIFLTPSMATSDAHVDMLDTAKNLRLQSSLSTAYPLDALLITGKSGERDDSSKLEDSLYVLDAEGQYIRKFKPESNCTNGRLVRDGDGEIYQVDHDKGLLRLSDGVCIIPPAIFAVDIEPRNGSNAQISIGLHSEYISYDDELVPVWVGYPILDATFDAEGYVYITPAVVNPDVGEPYETVARLQLLSEENPSYRIVQLYDDPPPPSDNRDQNNLREIEVSDSGNLYVINTGNLNESDILWVYDIDTGQVKDRAELGNLYSDCFLPAPVAMHISNTRDMLYMASSQNDPNSICTSVYAFSEGDLSVVAAIDVNGMGHVTDITDDPMTGTLWIIGFTMLDIPDYIDSNAEPFYAPYLARIPYENNEAVEAVCLYDPVSYSDNDLALPLSIVWTAVEENKTGLAGYVANQR